MLTVVMATHNGGATLPVALDALSAMRAPRGGWHLVAVDNGSIDQSTAILGSFRERLPLTCLRVPVRGQNRARNLGLTRATGDLVVFTDDDVLPRPDWLVQLRAAADAHLDFTIFGGVVVPRWQVAPHDWVLRGAPLTAAFAVTDPAWAEGPIHADHVFSPNMAVRATVFQAGYRFDETIGPGPGEYAMGSETELTRRLALAGHRAWHSRAAVVEHLIPGGHMTREWLLARATRFGRGSYRWGLIGARPRRCSGARLLQFVLRRALAHGLSLVRETWWSGDAARSFVHRWELCVLLGVAVEAGLVPWRRPTRPRASMKRTKGTAPC